MNFFETRNADGVDQAVCADEQSDPEWWFEPHFAELATYYCRQCPLMAACLTFALDEDEVHGVWGGATPDQRRVLRRSHKPKPKDLDTAGRRISPFTLTKKG